MTKFPEYVPYDFQDLISSCLVHIQPIPQISCNFLSYFADTHANRQTAV